MSTVVFIHVHGRDGLTEAQLPDAPTSEHLRGILAELGVELDDDTYIFIDEDEKPLERKRHQLPDIKRGCRIHVSRCRKIIVTMHFLEQTEEHTFPPGARVKRVKSWAVDKFKLDRHDAAEHVLQLCNSTDRPPTDTALHELTKAPICAVCFDLVPEKRVEG